MDVPLRGFRKSGSSCTFHTSDMACASPYPMKTPSPLKQVNGFVNKACHHLKIYCTCVFIPLRIYAVRLLVKLYEPPPPLPIAFLNYFLGCWVELKPDMNNKPTFRSELILKTHWKTLLMVKFSEQWWKEFVTAQKPSIPWIVLCNPRISISYNILWTELRTLYPWDFRSSQKKHIKVISLRISLQ